MFLRKLRLLTLAATKLSRRRNAHVVWLPRSYSSPAVSQSLATSKSPYKRLSRADRLVLVESFVNEYRAANAGKFPTLENIRREVGGSIYILRNILQELKLKPNAPLPIVAKTRSDVSASVPNDVSSPTLADTDPCSHSSACNAKHSSAEVGIPDKFEQGGDKRIVDSSHPSSDETDFQGNRLVITAATHDKKETETAPTDEVDSKCGGNLVLTTTECKTDTEAAHSPKSTSVVFEESLKSSETEEAMHLGSQEAKGVNPERAAVSDNGSLTETRLVLEKEAGEVKSGEKSSAWSNIMSFAREFANLWRKG